MFSRLRTFHFVPFCLFIAALIGVCLYMAKEMGVPNQIAYQKLTSSVEGSTLAPERFVQRRKGVQKALWLYRNQARFPIHLTAKSSELFLDKGEGFSERFEQVICRLEEPENLSTLKADRVSIFGDQAFLEGDVEYSHPLGKMKCQKAQIRWKGQTIEEIEAWYKVSLDQTNGWKVEADRFLWNPLTQKAFFFADLNRQVIFQDGEKKMYALYAEVEPHNHLCTLKGSVKLIHREGALRQYVVADQVVLSQEKGECRFFADPGKRVLFFDAANHLQMSASELKALRDPITDKEKVEGKGDVRFRLSEQEFQRLKNGVGL